MAGSVSSVGARRPRRVRTRRAPGLACGASGLACRTPGLAYRAPGLAYPRGGCVAPSPGGSDAGPGRSPRSDRDRVSRAASAIRRPCLLVALRVGQQEEPASRAYSRAARDDGKARVTGS
jgi:hypothetical protein